jgi:phosphopantothenoylcysteine synthetase/decarboxylase
MSLTRQAIERGWTVQVVSTPAALAFIDVQALEQQTGSPVRSQYSPPGSARSKVPDAIIVAPATCNTICKWACGTSGTYALGILAEQAAVNIPVIVLPFANAALASRSPFKRAVESLREERYAHPPRPRRSRATPAPQQSRTSLLPLARPPR